MEVLWTELTAGFGDGPQFERVLIRIIAAVVLGTIIGLPRQLEGKAAGLRTHILVTLGSCVFVLAAVFGMTPDGVSRVVQGIVTGIGFIGAGSIIKMREDVHGLTSSALIWLAAAVGVEVGLGEVGVAALVAIIGVGILTLVKRFERRTGYNRE